MNVDKMKQWIFLSAATLILMACSGGGGDDGVEGTGGVPKTIVGTAAEGAAIAQAPLAAKSLNGNKASTTTANDGKFSVTVNTTGGVLLKVDTQSGKTLYSIASDAGTTNIHPFTDLIIRNWFAVQGLDINAEFTNDSAFSKLPTVDEVNLIKAVIKNLVAQALLGFGLPADFDLMSTEFNANGLGFDGFLDFSSVVIVNNQITVLIIDPVTGIETNLVINVNLNTDFTLPDNQDPTTPENLRAVPASATEIIVVWNPSTDNIGVKAYNVYRNGELIATTPYPVFIDSGLVQSTDYCYAVEAVDASGRTSGQISTPTPCPQTLGSADTTAPQIPTQPQAVTLGPNSISLSWVQSGIGDVIGFNIYRGTTGNVNTRISSVTSTTFTNFNLLSSTEYCYKVSAYDAAGNESALSTQACAATEAGTNPNPSGNSMLAIALSEYQVNEFDGTVAIVVNRTGDASENVSVSYSLSSGSATADLDFVQTSGTLAWNPFEIEPKTIYIQIKGDSIVEGVESFTLNLTSPSANTTLGNSSAVIAIANEQCAGSLPSTVNSPTTVSDRCVLVNNSVSVNSTGSLTINPGVTLIFNSNAGINVSSGGFLKAEGSEQKPILFTSNNNPMPGAWYGIQFTRSNHSSNSFNYVTVEYAGANGYNGNAGIVLYDTTSSMSLSNSTLRMNQGFGIEMVGTIAMPTFNNNVITKNTLNPVSVNAVHVDLLKASNDYTGNGIDEIYIDAGSINAAQGAILTWPRLNVPYNVGNLSISRDVVIQSGVFMKFRDTTSGINVNFNGSLRAEGELNNRIVFSSASNTQVAGSWRGIQLTRSASSNNKLNYVTIENGGLGYNETGGIVLYDTTSRATISNTIIRNNIGPGARFTNTVILDGFTNNVITENETYPVIINAAYVDYLDTTTDYTGNGVDEVYVAQGSINSIDVSPITNKFTWPYIGVPYSVGDATINAAVSVAPGVTMRMRANSEIQVTFNGALEVQGSAQSPITFTSTIATPGYWDGIIFVNSASPLNVLNYSIVEYAGIPGVLGQGNVRVYNQSTVTITNSNLRNSSTYGLWISSNSNAITNADFPNVYSGNQLGDLCKQSGVPACPQ